MGDNVSDNVDFIPWLNDEYPDGDNINYWNPSTTVTGEEEIDETANADTTVNITTTAPVEVTVQNYTENPTGQDVPQGATALGKYIDINVSDKSAVTFPIHIRIYYTADDLDNAVMSEDDLQGIAYYNGSLGKWLLCSDTGVNTTNTGSYEGYLWANLQHDELSPKAPVGGDYDWESTIQAEKTATDMNGGRLEPGDTLEYTITITNNGDMDSLNNPGNEFEDGIPDGTTYVGGSATASSGTVAYNGGSTMVTWNGIMLAGDTVEISFQVTVNGDVTSATLISNQGTVYYDSDGDEVNDAEQPTDDPATAATDDATGTWVDLEAPVSDLTVTLDPDGYYIPASTFHISAEDDSGIWKVYYRIDGGTVKAGSWNKEAQFQINELHGYQPGEHTVEYWAVDSVGNIETPHHVETYVLDTSGPSTAISFEGIAEVTAEQTWQITADTSMVLTATDDHLGVDGICYRIEGGEWMSYNEPFTIEEPGTYTVYYYAKDVMGNIGDMHSTTIDVGGGMPSSSCSVTPEPTGDNGWYTTGATVSLSAFDEASGVSHIMYRVDNGAWKVYDGNFAVDSDGEHDIEYYAVDNVGNEEPVNTEQIKIDLFGPEITISRPTGHLYLFNRAILPTASGRTIVIGQVSIEADVEDTATSGVASTSLYLDGELRTSASEDISYVLDETLMGMHTITVEAYDVAGNRATETVTATIYNIQLFSENS